MTENCFGINEWQLCNPFMGAAPCRDSWSTYRPWWVQGLGTRPLHWPIWNHTPPRIKYWRERVWPQPWQTLDPSQTARGSVIGWESTLSSCHGCFIKICHRILRKMLAQSPRNILPSLHSPAPKSTKEHIFDISRQFQKKVTIENYIV